VASGKAASSADFEAGTDAEGLCLSVTNSELAGNAADRSTPPDPTSGIVCAHACESGSCRDRSSIAVACQAIDGDRGPISVISAV
jgi:hypothetical protein